MNPPPTSTAPNPRRRIFIIDDFAMVRERLGSLVALESDMEYCGEAQNAATALPALRKARADLVVVDLSLKDSSGLWLVKEIRTQFPAVLILALSMHDEVSFAERAFQAGARGYMAKREPGACVVEAIRTVLAGRFYTGPALATQLTGRMFGGSGRTAGLPSELLSDREMEVFQQRGAGRGTKEIAEQLKVSVKTIESYEARTKEKLGLKNSTELVRAAMRWHDRALGQ